MEQLKLAADSEAKEVRFSNPSNVSYDMSLFLKPVWNILLSYFSVRIFCPLFLWITIVGDLIILVCAV